MTAVDSANTHTHDNTVSSECKLLNDIILNICFYCSISRSNKPLPDIAYVLQKDK